MTTISSVKNRFPFALGCTSYIIPADIIPNVSLLAPVVDDIELVFFEAPEISNTPSDPVICDLSELAEQHNTSYTVHLPIDNRAGAQEKSERDKFCDAACSIIKRCRPLQPVAWIIHLEGISKEASDNEKQAWVGRCSESLDVIVNEIADPSKIAIENLEYPWYWHENIALRYGTSLCCDVGHLWLYFENDWEEHFKSMLPRTSVIHFHGVACGKDHISLAKGDRMVITEFLRILLNYKYTGVVTLELFNEKDLRESMEVISEIWEQLH